MKREPKYGMKIRGHVGVPDAEEDQIVDSWVRLYDKAAGEIEARGFEVPNKPKHSVELLSKDNLIGTSPEEFADLYSKYLAWYQYATPYMAEIRARLLGLETSIKDIAITIKSELRKVVEITGKMTKDELDEAVWVDPRHKELQRDLILWKQKKELLSAHIDVIDRNMKLISRLVEERKIDTGGTQRDSGVRSESLYQARKSFRRGHPQ